MGQAPYRAVNSDLLDTKIPAFMKSEGSLQCLQVPVSGS